MAVATIVALILFSKSSKATAIPYSPSHRPCAEFILPVPATVQQAIYDTPHVDSNIDVTQWTVVTDTWSNTPSPLHIVRNQTIDDTFDISVQLCVPANGAKKTSLQIASHGLVFDKRYWDVAINPEEYSYVQSVLEAGYSILTYDRLGTGLSAKPDAYDIVQGPLQLQILRQITNMAKAGDILTVAQASNSAIPNVNFDKLIHVGHSYGSFLTAALLADYGGISDAAIITGFIPNEHAADFGVAAFGFQLASENDPIRFGDRPSGYIVPGTVSALQTAFFYDDRNDSTTFGGFDPAMLDYGNSIKQPLTVGELTSVPMLHLAGSQTFAGPLQYMEAEFDSPICGGDCNNVYDLDVLKALYPKVSDLEVYTQPATGHGLTLHHNARDGYQATLDWLEKNGL